MPAPDEGEGEGVDVGIGRDAPPLALGGQVRRDGGRGLGQDRDAAPDGATIEEAVDEMVDALRDYAEAWTERLRLAPNHEDNWGLVQIVTLASDDQLRTWLLAD